MQTTALTFLVIGLVFFVFNLQTMVSLHGFRMRVKRKRYQLLSHVYFLAELNDEVISELREGGLASIYDAPEDPPYFIVLSPDYDNRRRQRQ